MILQLDFWPRQIIGCIIPPPIRILSGLNARSHTALVTGGNSGIGYATAKVLKDQGAGVIITGRREEAVQKAAAELAGRTIPSIPPPRRRLIQ